MSDDWQDFFTSADFQIIDKLGEGAMGVVLKAEYDGSLVAIKVISPEVAKDKEFQKRFLREMSAVAAMDHPNIVKAIDYGVDIEKDRYFVVLEFVDGEPLSDRMHRLVQLPVEMALEITQKIADGLQHAFEKGMFHRDIKPDNILLSNTEEVKITDFGLVKSDSGVGLTVAGSILGTPYYLAPEMAMGDGEVDHRADIYSLGITLYHMLAGRPPYEYESAMRIITAHCTKPLPPITEKVKDLHPEVIKLIEWMTEKYPDKRPANPSEVSREIARIKEEIRFSEDMPTPPGGITVDFDPAKEASKQEAAPAKPSDKKKTFTLSGTLTGTLTGLKGKLKTINLAELIQIITLGAKTGMLKVSEESQEGHIDFVKGQITNAEVGDLTGQEAFFHLIRWHKGKFSFREQEIESPPTIEGDTRELVMEGLRILDESNREGEVGGRQIEELTGFSPLTAEEGRLQSMMGKLNVISPAEIIHTIAATAKTGTLVLTQPKQNGEIHFVQGQAVNAHCGDLKAEDAFLELLSWEMGRFMFDDDEPEVEKVIEWNTMAMLMEGLRVLEEEIEAPSQPEV